MIMILVVYRLCVDPEILHGLGRCDEEEQQFWGYVNAHIK